MDIYTTQHQGTASITQAPPPKPVPELQLTQSCEIGNLIDVIVARAGKKPEECEKAADDAGLFPEGQGCYANTKWPPKEDDNWFAHEVHKLMVELKLESLYIDWRGN